MSRLPWLQDDLNQLARDMMADRMPHALVVSGEQGIGVRKWALDLTALRLCFETGTGSSPPRSACGECKSCQLLLSGAHPDVRILRPDGASQMIKIDQVRGLVDFLMQTPQISNWKLAVFEQAHRMNNSAANALLKVLEEPPGNSLLILATERPQILLPTVRSRCAQRRLPSPTEAQSKEYLESLEVSADQVAEALAELGCRPLQIAAWLEDGTLAAWQLCMQQVEQLGSARIDAIEAADRLKEQELSQVIDWLIAHLSARIRNQAGNKGEQPANFRLYDLLLAGKRSLDSGSNPNTQLSLEAIFLEWVSCTPLR